MSYKMVALAGGALLVACVTTPPEPIELMGVREICERLQLPTFTTAGEARRAAMWAELERREAFGPETLADIKAHRLQIGMSELAMTCSWGRPSKENRTTTARGTRIQYVYESYLGASLGSRYRYVYTEGNIITAIQD
jgi:hypothetical protein